MSFVGERIVTEEDKKYVNAIAFRNMTGQVLEPRWWAIDREKNWILVARGGGSFEIPEGYALYMDGEILEIEGYARTQGSRFESNLVFRWSINRIVATKAWINKKYDKDMFFDVLKEAFIAYSHCGLKKSQILNITVDIQTTIQRKTNSRGEEI